MPASFKKQLRLTGSPEDFLKMTVTAMLRLGWDIRHETYNMVKARATMSMMSWGEDIVVRIDQNDIIHISSKFVFPTFIDLLGRNRKNINALMFELRDLQKS